MRLPDWYKRVVQMALPMSRPWKHPITGIYWLRKGVPEELRPIIGKREEKFSLRTKDPEVAKERHAKALAEVNARWKDLRARPPEAPAAGQAALTTLTERQAHQKADWMYRFWLGKYRDNPSEQVFWQTDLFDRLWRQPERPVVNLLNPDDSSALELNALLPPEEMAARRLEEWCFDEADDYLAIHELDVDEDSRLRLAKAIAAAVQRASLQLARWAKGELNTLPSQNSFGSSAGLSNHADKHPPVTFEELLQGWSAERKPVEKTVYEWGRIIKELAEFLGHDNAARLQPDDLIRWKAEMVAEELSSKTIKEGKLSPVRTILQWGVNNRKIPANPAERVTIDVKSNPSEAKRGFNDEEAKVVLNAALLERNPVRRWVPWLCAYSGARVSEICQLRVEDILQIEGVWCMKFDPEAGSLKTRSSERAVPLHPALVESGFLDFVEGAKLGPLFPTLPPNKFGSRGGNGTKVIGRWVRSLGIKDKRISPCHSWRHRFKTLGRRYGLALDIVNAITGHGRKTVADGYGEYPIEALSRELAKVPNMLEVPSSSD